MKPHQLLATTALSVLFVSCATKSGDNYDTSDPYGAADYGTPYQPVNPTYDTPAAYEETGGAPVNPPAAAPSSSPASSSSAPSRSGSTVHTIVRGDTLWGLSRTYGVSVDAIKRANSMTKDTVVLGQKLVIPAR